VRPRDSPNGTTRHRPGNVAPASAAHRLEGLSATDERRWVLLPLPLDLLAPFLARVTPDSGAAGRNGSADAASRL
jgi:hypothetical protein